MTTKKKWTMDKVQSLQHECFTKGTVCYGCGNSVRVGTYVVPVGAGVAHEQYDSTSRLSPPILILKNPCWPQ